MKKILFFFLILWLSLSLKAQDPAYSQFSSTNLYVNPAFTGLYTGLRARFSFRDQWPNLPYDFKSYLFAADLGDRNLPGAGGIGLIVNSDNEGVAFINNFSLGINLSVRIPFSEQASGQIGVKAAVVQKRVNWDDMVFLDQLDPRYGNINQSAFMHPDGNKVVFPDFAIGGLIQFSNENSSVSGSAGLGIDHLFQPDESFLSTIKAPVPRKYTMHCDLNFIVDGGSSSSYYAKGESLKINPLIVYMFQNNINLLELGANFSKYNLYLGLMFRNTVKSSTTNSMVLSAGYKFYFAEAMNIKFTYSYDLQMGGDLQGTGGAHEIGLILSFEDVGIFGGTGTNGPFRSYQRNSGVECSDF